MIDELRVHNIALISDVSISPAPVGLTVLTGETGTGKSALLSSIKLLMGERSDTSVIREGADALEVEGRLYVSDGDPDGTIVRRRLETGGRGRVEINGKMASVRELAQTVGSTIDLCGQHEHQKLLTQSSHIDLIDTWAGEELEPQRSAYKKALAQARSTKDELERVRKDSRATSARLDEAEFILARINEIDPQENEYEILEEDLPRVEHAESLLEAAIGAHRALSGEGAAEDMLSDAISALRSASQHDNHLKEFAQALESLLIDMEDISRELRSYRDTVDVDPHELERMQERMAALRSLMRSYGPSMRDVFDRKERAERLVLAAHDGGEALRKAEQAYQEAETSLERCADALDDARSRVMPRFAELVSEQMSYLQMGGARIECSSERMPRSQWNADGASRIELLYRPAAGLTPRPLRKIASGGEISRVMLAIKVVLGESDGTETLIFDEVDAGVGGATAVALAQMLSRLAKSHQVIVVTHLAQIAVQADCHYLVSKTDGDVPVTTIEHIESEDRVAEIARMLSGDTSSVSLDHARELLGYT